MDVNGLWPALKMYLGMGATGATAVIFIVMWLKGNARNQKLNEDRSADQKQYNKDMMMLQSSHTKELIGLIRQYDNQVSSLNKTIDKLLSHEA